jgi:hypothetical protein
MPARLCPSWLATSRGEQLPRPAAGPPRRPRIGGMASTSGISSVTSLRLPPVGLTASGMSPASQIRWCLEPGRPRSTGEGPTWAPVEGAHVRAVDRAAVQVQLAVGAQLVQQQFVQRWPDAGLGPVARPPPAGHVRSADQGRRQLVPVDPSLKHEHDPGQRGAVLDRPAARIAVATWLGRLRQRSDPLPQPVRNELPRSPTPGCSGPARAPGCHAGVIQNAIS